jgi:hypothetical protein
MRIQKLLLLKKTLLNHVTNISSLKVRIDEKELKRLSLLILFIIFPIKYWIPKLHKKPLQNS